MDYSQPQQQPVQEKKSVTDHIGSAWSGFKGMFSDNSEPTAPAQTMGGRRRRRYKHSMKGGKAKKAKKAKKGKSVKTHRGGKSKRVSKHRRSGKSHSRRH